MPAKTRSEKIAATERKVRPEMAETSPLHPTPGTRHLDSSLHDLRQTLILTAFLTSTLFLLWILQMKHFV